MFWICRPVVVYLNGMTSSESRFVHHAAALVEGAVSSLHRPYVLITTLLCLFADRFQPVHSGLQRGRRQAHLHNQHKRRPAGTLHYLQPVGYLGLHLLDSERLLQCLRNRQAVCTSPLSAAIRGLMLPGVCEVSVWGQCLKCFALSSTGRPVPAGQRRGHRGEAADDARGAAGDVLRGRRPPEDPALQRAHFRAR